MFNFLKRKEPLEVGQIYENNEKNPFASRWQAKIISLQNGYVKYAVYGVNSKGGEFDNFPSLNKSDKENDFRFYYPNRVL